MILLYYHALILINLKHLYHGENFVFFILYIYSSGYKNEGSEFSTFARSKSKLTIYCVNN